LACSPSPVSILQEGRKTVNIRASQLWHYPGNLGEVEYQAESNGSRRFGG
jgi:hypothetical protein